MSSLANVSIPKPKDWQSFERSMTVLMACVLDDPNTTCNGRSGQPQNGVDVYGYRKRDVTQLVGVQCKKKLHVQVTEKELRDEVGKARNFKPNLKEFILATTAPRDQAIQTVARAITDELSKTAWPVTVVVWGWDDIEERASKYKDAFSAFDPTYNPYAERAFEKLEATLQQAIDHFKSSIQAAPQPTDLTVDAGHENTPLHGQISAYFDLVNDGHVQTALTQLEKIRTTAWATASRSERYRLLVAFAAVKAKKEDYAAAGYLLLDAFEECPEHKKAKQNRAKGYLLTSHYAMAVEIALEVIQSNPGNADAASTLIQARMHDRACQTPLNDIPAALLESEDVLIAHVTFLRFREDMGWLPLVRQAAKKHPASRHLRIMAAESVLEDLSKNDRDVLAGAPVRVVTQEELETAVKTLADEALACWSRCSSPAGARLAPPAACCLWRGRLRGGRPRAARGEHLRPGGPRRRQPRCLPTASTLGASLSLCLAPSSPLPAPPSVYRPLPRRLPTVFACAHSGTPTCLLASWTSRSAPTPLVSSPRVMLCCMRPLIFELQPGTELALPMPCLPAGVGPSPSVPHPECSAPFDPLSPMYVLHTF